MTAIAGVEAIEVLVAGGITHLVGLPDNTSASLFAAAVADPRIALLAVTREGEAFAVASGLWMGGRTPAVIIQNTGLLESGDSLRGTASRMGIPLPVLVTFRGHHTLVRADQEPPGLHQRPDVDSVALMTEPTLEAWAVPSHTMNNPEDLARVIRQAQAESRPVACLVTDRLI